jgi:hypothetical protein
MMNGQSGQALPLAIAALAIGALVVAPFLGYAGNNLIGSQVYGQAITQQSACDAGVEHAIWSLTKGELAEQFTQSGDEVTYQLSESINNLTVSITVTANATGGGSAGDIADTIIDTLEFDNANGYEPSIINVYGEVFAIAYRGTSGDGFLKTISINADGEIENSVINTLEFDNANGYEPCIIYVSGNIYAIAYRGSANDGFLKTVSIDASGYIGNSAIDTLEFDNSNGYEPSIINVSGNVYAIAYRGPGNDGFLKTVSIDASGQIGNSAIDTLEFDTSNGYEPSIINVYGDVFTIAYRGTSKGGYLKTVTIDANGNIGNSIIDVNNFDSYCYEPCIINISNEMFGITYRGSGNRGYLITMSIAADGDIASSVTDTIVFDASSGYEPEIINTSSNIYGIAYRGPSNDGFVKTVGIEESGGPAAYEITATAGDRTIHAFVTIDNGTATITSWQIE